MESGSGGPDACPFQDTAVLNECMKFKLDGHTQETITDQSSSSFKCVCYNW